MRGKRTGFIILVQYKVQNPHEGDFDFVAGERLVLSGKIQLPDFPVEISTSKWETSSFLYHKNTSRSIRLVKLSASELPSPEARTLLAGISLITEILLD
jgi:hypothetical protein